jgi:hypothetical protein
LVQTSPKVVTKRLRSVSSSKIGSRQSSRFSTLVTPKLNGGGRAQALEREANIIADLPRIYGKPEEYRFYKGDPNNDIQPVSKEALIGAIKKCHQTLWAGGKLSPPAVS